MKCLRQYLGIIVCTLSFTQLLYCPAIPTNFFNAQDILVVSPGIDIGFKARLNVGFESSFEFDAFQADDDDQCPDWRKRCNVLQLWQDEQNALAAVKGNDAGTNLGQFAQLFNMDDDNGTHGHFIPCGKLQLNSFLASFQWCLRPNCNIGLYVPVYWGSLKNVTWREKNNHVTYEDNLVPHMITALEKLGGMNLYGWQRSGFGDIVGLFSWLQDFPQNKIILRNVRTGLRGGLNFPTGKPEGEDQLLAIPFGWDGGAGFIMAGYLELTLDWRIRLALDVELMHLFGNTRCRRIKTDIAQTDLLFLTKATTYKEPGFTQHFTLFGEYVPSFMDGLSLRASYQFTKHMEDKLFLNTNQYDPVIVNSAESLQEWTTHSAVFQILYEHFRPGATIQPSASFFVKYGFNGKRALLANTVGFTCGIEF